MIKSSYYWKLVIFPELIFAHFTCFNQPPMLQSQLLGRMDRIWLSFCWPSAARFHGLIQRASTFSTDRINHIYQDPHDPNARLFLYYSDLAKGEQLINLIYNVKPDENNHFSVQSHVRGALVLQLFSAITRPRVK